jgi:hypothetical protein
VETVGADQSVSVGGAQAVNRESTTNGDAQFHVEGAVRTVVDGNVTDTVDGKVTIRAEDLFGGSMSEGLEGLMPSPGGRMRRPRGGVGARRDEGDRVMDEMRDGMRALGRAMRGAALVVLLVAGPSACGRDGGSVVERPPAPERSVTPEPTRAIEPAPVQAPPSGAEVSPVAKTRPLADLKIDCPPGTTQQRKDPDKYYDAVRIWCEDALGQYEGLLREYFLDGQIAMETPYHEGFPEGRSRTWYPDGTLASERTNRRGKVNGISRHWHSNGRLRSEARYVENKAVGIGRYRDEKGKLIRVRDFAKEPGFVPAE